MGKERKAFSALFSEFRADRFCYGMLSLLIKSVSRNLRISSSKAAYATVKWRPSDDDLVAPLRLRFGGSITPTMKWLLYADDSQCVNFRH